MKVKRLSFILPVLLCTLFMFFNQYAHMSGLDSIYHMTRIEEISRGMSEGNWFPVIQSDNLNGMGYMNEPFYPHIWIQAAALLTMAGVPVYVSECIMAVIASLLACFLTYILFRKRYDKNKLQLFCVLYYCWPVTYIYIIKIWGDYPLMIASLFLPIVLLSLPVIYDEGKIYPLVIGLSGVLASNIPEFFLTVLIIAVYCVYRWKETFSKKIIMLYLKAIGMFVAANAYFLIPFFYYFFTQNIKIKKPGGLTAYELKGIAVSDPMLGTTIFIGFAIICVIYGASQYKKRLRWQDSIPLEIGFASLLPLFVSVSIIPDIWGLSVRLLTISPVFLMYGIAFKIEHKKERVFPVTCIYIAISILMLRGVNTVPENFSKMNDCNVFYDKSSIPSVKNGEVSPTRVYEEIGKISVPEIYHMVVGGEYLPQSFDIGIMDNENGMDIGSNEEKEKEIYDELFSDVSSYSLEERRANGDYTFNIELKQEIDMLSFPVLYYKGYKAEINGKATEVFDNDGFVTIKSPKSGTVHIYFDTAPVYEIGLIISITILAINAIKKSLTLANKAQ